MRLRMALVVSIALVLGSGCGDDDDPPQNDDGGIDGGTDAGPDGSVEGAEIVASLTGIPESLALHDGTVYATFITGEVVQVSSDGDVEDFATVVGDGPIDPANSGYALGVAVAEDGTVFVAVARVAEGGPTPGVYRIPAEGGEGELYASNPGLTIPNDIAIANGQLYITDAPTGTIFVVDADAEEALIASPWAQDDLLEPVADDAETRPCGERTSPFPIGANGIVVEEDRVVVTSSERGALVTIAIEEGGDAGEVEDLVMNTATLCGADGLARDTDGTYLVNTLGSSVYRVSADGATRTLLHMGLPLRTPAGIDVGTFGSGRQIVISSPDFEAVFGGETPMPNISAIAL